MRTILTLFAAIVIVAACKKDKPVPPNPVDNTDSTDSTKVPKLKDSTIKIVGIDSVVTLGIYDSIVIPFTVTRDTGSVQNVTLSISQLPMRMKGSFATTSGTTPFTNSLKLNTYLFAGGYSADILVITATTSNGLQTRHKFRFKIDYTKQDPTKLFYEVYRKTPFINTYDESGNHVWGGPALHYDTTTGLLYMTGLFLGQHGGKNYRTLDDVVIPSNNIIQYKEGPTMSAYGQLIFGLYSVKGYSSNDTANFDVELALMYYYQTPYDSIFTFNYSLLGINSQRFSCVGTLKFY
jgi:microcystin-dependent protein